jgi:hypothetical protein
MFIFLVMFLVPYLVLDLLRDIQLIYVQPTVFNAQLFNATTIQCLFRYFIVAFVRAKHALAFYTCPVYRICFVE